jgi:hypothetical protein
MGGSVKGPRARRDFIRPVLNIDINMSKEPGIPDYQRCSIYLKHPFWQFAGNRLKIKEA